MGSQILGFSKIRGPWARGAVFTPFLTVPPFGGGAVRVLNLYKEFALKGVRIYLVGVVSGQEAGKSAISKNLLQVAVHKSREFAHAERKLQERASFDLLGDVSLSTFPNLVQRMLHASLDEEWFASLDFLIVSHPFLWPALQIMIKKKNLRPLLIYDAHNVEYLLKKDIYTRLDPRVKQELLDVIFSAEGELCREADIIFSTSLGDARKLRKIYRLSSEKKILVVPNPVDLANIGFKGLGTKFPRVGNKAIFLGSYHPPNIEAVRNIFKFAEALPKINFLVAGGVGDAFREVPHPPNLKFLGFLGDSALQKALQEASIALAPISYGSGTNIKALTYLACGVPVVATPFAVRGLGLRNGREVQISSLGNFPDSIRRLIDNPQLQAKLAYNGRKLVEERYDAQRVAEKALAAISKYISEHASHDLQSLSWKSSWKLFLFENRIIFQAPLKKIFRFFYRATKVILFLFLPYFLFVVLRALTEKPRGKIKEFLGVI